MSTLTPFTPNAQTIFSFQATLDGAPYNVTTRWNTYAQRYFVEIDDQNGTRVLTKPMIGSPADYPISLIGGYFVSTMVFWEATQTFEVTP